MLDINDGILNPLTLSSGSHERGSNKGCAMNVVSYVNGDAEITDFPDCSDTFLAFFVQNINDTVANQSTRLISAEYSIPLLEMAFDTVGTKRLDLDPQLRYLCILRAVIEQMVKLRGHHHYSRDPMSVALGNLMYYFEHGDAAYLLEMIRLSAQSLAKASLYDKYYYEQSEAARLLRLPFAEIDSMEDRLAYVVKTFMEDLVSFWMLRVMGDPEANKNLFLIQNAHEVITRYKELAGIESQVTKEDDIVTALVDAGMVECRV